MNSRTRLSISFMLSLSFHIVLVMWVMTTKPEVMQEGFRVLQVILQTHSTTQQRPNKVVPASLSVGDTKANDPSAATSDISGKFHWQPPPAHGQANLLNEMRQAQFAHQQGMQRAAVSDSLNDVVSKMEPLLKESVTCTQQQDDVIDCVPVPNEEMKPLLERFLYLATDAHRFGMAQNPMKIEFASKHRVSVEFRH
jgi:hypothetical protein